MSQFGPIESARLAFAAELERADNGIIPPGCAVRVTARLAELDLEKKTCVLADSAARLHVSLANAAPVPWTPPALVTVFGQYIAPKKGPPFVDARIVRCEEALDFELYKQALLRRRVRDMLSACS